MRSRCHTSYPVICIETLAAIRQRTLTRTLDLDKGVGSCDLSELAEFDIVEYVENGRATAPRLKHTHVVVEPVV